MATILVTGATGFIGRRLVEQLVTTGDNVRCFVRRAQRVVKRGDSQLAIVEGQFDDPAALATAVRGVDYVFHLAGATTARRKQDFLRVNQDYVRLIAEACAAEPTPPVLVSVSSLAAAGPTSPDRPRIESDPPCPVSNYGRSKWSGEQELLRMAERLPISIVRPPIVFGPGDLHMLSMFRSVKTGVHVVPTFRQHRFSLVHVDDLITGMRAIADRGERLSGRNDSQYRGIYYITGLERPTYGELGTLIGQALGRRFNVLQLRLPGLFCHALGGACEMLSWFQSQPSILNLDKMREATAGSWTCLSDRANRHLGFRTEHSLVERLTSTANWYRSNGLL